MGWLYDRNLDDGKGEVKETEIPLDGSSAHITQYNRENNTRYSWDTSGSDADSRDNLHFTDQDKAKGSSTRHG